MILLYAGKPLRPHQKSLCQACSDGICRIGAWRSRQRLNSISFFKYYISNLASYQSYFVFLRMSVPFIFLFRPSSRLFISFISLFATDRECECHRVFGHFPFQLFVYFLFLNKKNFLSETPVSMESGNAGEAAAWVVVRYQPIYPFNNRWCLSWFRR